MRVDGALRPQAPPDARGRDGRRSRSPARRAGGGARSGARRVRGPLRGRRPARRRQARRASSCTRARARVGDAVAGARRRRGRRRGRPGAGSCTASTATRRGCSSSPSSAEAHRRSRRALQAREVTREYLALVEGRPPARTGTIDAPIGRDRRVRTRDVDRHRRAARARSRTSRSRRRCRARRCCACGSRPAARTRSASTCRRSAIRWWATRSTGRRGGSGSSASSCTPRACAFAQPFTGAPVDVGRRCPRIWPRRSSGRAPRPARRSPGGRSSWPSAKSRSTSFSGVSGSSSWPSLKRPTCSSSGDVRGVLLALAEVAHALLVGRLDLGLLPFGEAFVAVLGRLSGVGGIAPGWRSWSSAMPGSYHPARRRTQITQVTRV